MEEQFDSVDRRITPQFESPFSTDACELLGGAVRVYLETGGVPEELARATERLCREAHARGLSADETLAQIRESLGGILSAGAVTSSDRAALMALAIDECVHAFYHQHR